MMLVAFAVFCSSALAGSTPTAFLTETIPPGLDLILTTGARTHVDTLIEITKRATHTLDVTVMYWNLLNHGSKNITNGSKLYQAMQDAAKRGVSLRFLQSYCRPGNSMAMTELEDLQKEYPSNVAFRVWNAGDWYGGGIMHQKVWIADERDTWIGSANMDWLSLTQVKEMGVAVYDSPELSSDVVAYFERWWQWAGLNSTVSSTGNRSIFDPQFQVQRTVPCWSQKVAAADRCSLPFKAADTKYNAASPMSLSMNGALSSTYITGSPSEIDETRTFDEQGLVNTILSATESVSLSVMDFIPSSLYAPPAQAVWWDALVNPILLAATAKGVKVRLLISKWAHTSASIPPYLRALQAMGNACSEGSQSHYAPKCTGSLEIRLMALPGWNETVPQGDTPAKYPAFSRVNHAKYIVTDKRFNIGTSNMAWGYFYTTAGTSFNSDHAGLRTSLQKAFDRDWDSAYAEPLTPTTPAPTPAPAPPTPPTPPTPPPAPTPPSKRGCCYSADQHCDVGAVCCKANCVLDPSKCSYSQSGCAGDYGQKHKCEWDGKLCIVGNQ